MSQSFNRGFGLKRTPLAIGLSMVLAAGVMSDAVASQPVTGLRAWREQIEELREATYPARHQQFLNRLDKARSRAEAVVAGVTPEGSTAVTNCDDDGAGSLRAAVAAATDGDTIDLTALTCSTITLTTGGITVAVDNLTITGPGSGELTIDANNGGTAFDVSTYGGALEIEGVTLTNGYYYGYGGGAIWSAYGDVVLSDVVVSNSSAYATYGFGGGVLNYFGNIVLTDSIITGNAVDGLIGQGAGLCSKYGNVTLTDSVVSGNTADALYLVLGGGLAANEGNVSLTRSTVSDNAATGTYIGAWGGGVYSYGGHLESIDSTISGNTTSTTGGGFSVGSFSVVNSTVSGNAAGDFSGAGVAFGDYAEFELANSTITGNTAADGGGVLLVGYGSALALDSTIAFGNTSTAPYYYGADLDGYDVSTITGSHNLVGDSLLTLPGDTISDDPLLGALADNGGPTQTHALGAGSPAIDAGNNVAGLTNDQRGEGFDRVVGTAADIGAFEVQGEDPGPDPEPGPVELAPFRAVPATSNWVLGLMALMLGFLGWRRTER